MARQQFYQPGGRSSRDDEMHETPADLPVSRPPTPASDNASNALDSIDNALSENDQAMKALSPENLKDAEESATEPDNSSQDKAESSLTSGSDQVGRGYSDGRKKIKSRFSRKQKIASGGIAGLLVGGGFGLFTIVSGPLQVIHYAQSLMPNFGNHELSSTSRMSRLYRWAKTSEPGETRVGVMGSFIVKNAKASFLSDGIIVNSSNIGQMQSITIDTKNSSLYSSNTDAAKNRAAIARDNGLPIEDVRQVSGLKGGVFSVDVSKININQRRSIIRAHVEAQNYGKITKALKFRSLTKYYDAPSWLHPLSRISSSLDRRLAARVSNLKIIQEHDAKRRARIRELTPEAKARNAAIKSKLSTTAGVAGALLLGATAVCVAKDIAGQIPDINRDNVVVPAMKSAVDAIALGEALKNGDMPPDGLDQIGQVVRGFTDANGKTIWEAKALRAEQGKQGGEDIDPDIKQAFSPNSSAAYFEQELDSLGADSACSGVGQALQGIAGVALLVAGPGGWVAKGVTTATAAIAINAITTYVPKLLADEPLIPEFHQGPSGGNVDAYGAREVANSAYRASGGSELSPEQSTVLRNERERIDKEQFQEKSFAGRMFDVYDRRSAISRIIDNQSVDPAQNFTNIARGIVNSSSMLANLSSAFTQKALAEEVVYDYGFPEYGFSQKDLNDGSLEDPYANAEEAAKLLGGVDGQGYIDKAMLCFGVSVTKEAGGWDAVAQQDINPSSAEYSEEDCVDSGNPQWLKIRMFIFDTRTATGYACYEGDEESCTRLGYSSTATAQENPQESVVSSIVGDPYTDSSNVPCAAGTNDLGILDGYVDKKLVKMRICSLPNLPSNGRADIPNGEFTIPGGAGFGRVNSRVSGAWFALINDARANGISLTSLSSFRTKAHQQALCDENNSCSAGDYTWVAEPGTSSHQAGVAIDFDNGMWGVKGSITCATKAQAPDSAAWIWLRDNAARYGFKQYAPEAWHWDAHPSSCGAT